MPLAFNIVSSPNGDESEWLAVFAIIGGWPALPMVPASRF